MPAVINQGFGDFYGILKLALTIVVPMFLHKQMNIFENRDYLNSLPELNITVNHTFDFIIVGGGTAGCVLANRLTAPPNNYRVLMLEAGGNPSWISFMPGFDIWASNNPRIDWQYLSTPQNRSCLSCVGKRITASRGKGVGGCSNVNFLVYNRGSRYDFDEWAQITGDPSWSYSSVLNYFKKSENYHGNYPSDVHGCGGEFYVDKSEYMPGLEYFLGAIKNNSMGIVEQDINLNQTNAFMKMDQSSKDGIRWSTFTAFVNPITSRSNLVIRRYSMGTKLLFDPANATRVIGVEYVQHNVTKYAFASREVIVSSGSFNTPKLLMLSGIGPKDTLESHEIPVRKALPVGHRLQDHPSTILMVEFNTSFTSCVYERDLVPDTMAEALPPSRFGPFEGNNLLGTGYISSKYNDRVEHPDLEMFISYLGLSKMVPLIFGPLLNLHEKLIAALIHGHEGRDGNMVLMTLMKPRTHGFVTLNGTNPFNDPIIQPDFFSDPGDIDLKTLIEGVKYMINFYENTPAYQSIGARLLPVPWPNCRKHIFRSDEYWECYLRHVTFSLWHPSGTCKMARATDPTAVVDPKFSVIGIQNLRVVDASAMPTIPNGNTVAPTIMMAEKASDIIIREWGGYTSPPHGRRPCSINQVSTNPNDYALDE